ncbi:MAG: FAD-dependent monooxygenase [Burkholderiaceae bacterium]
MSLPEYDIAITGAGPVGSVLALLLARKASHRQRIALIGKQFIHSNAPLQAQSIDPRTLALNHGSRALLEQLNAWPAQSASIETVHVSQRNRMGRALIKNIELGVPRLGSVVSYNALLAALHRAVAQSGVDLIEAPQAIPALAQHVRINLGNRVLSCTVAVQSDGTRPAGLQRNYHQHAVLTAVHAGRPKVGWAFERFTTQGPLALLPHPRGNGLYSIVWCCRPERATHLQKLDNTAFSAALQDTFGERLGQLECVGARHVFPLTLHAGPSLLNPRTVAIGNAAQTLHPVAGQGLNLGLRDAAQLSQTLNTWLLQSHGDPGPLLSHFAHRRNPDRWLTLGLTDFLPRIFATENPVIQHGCGLSLLVLDLSSSIRTPLARHLLQGLRI